MENNEQTEVIEVPLKVPQGAGHGLCAAGIYGDSGASAMKERQRRRQGCQDRIYYRECIPCDRCGNCLEIRGFTVSGLEQLKGLWCIPNEFETTAYHTCDMARQSRNGRKKVVYDLENAPYGFAEGLSRTQLNTEIPESDGEVKPPKTGARDGYTGGSEQYKRIDRDREAQGSGKMPGRLMN